MEAIALFQCTAEADGDLEFQKGDSITIISQETSDEGWWLGEVNGQRGVFPANFVKLVVDSSALTSMTTANADGILTSVGGGGSTGLDFAALGAAVAAAEAANGGDGTSTGIIGNAPSTRGGGVSTPVGLSSLASIGSTSTTTFGSFGHGAGHGLVVTLDDVVTTAEALFDCVAEDESELSFFKGDEIIILNKVTEDEGWWEGKCRGMVGIFPSNYVKENLWTSTAPGGSVVGGTALGGELGTVASTTTTAAGGDDANVGSFGDNADAPTMAEVIAAQSSMQGADTAVGAGGEAGAGIGSEAGAGAGGGAAGIGSAGGSGEEGADEANSKTPDSGEEDDSVLNSAGRPTTSSVRAPSSPRGGGESDDVGRKASIGPLKPKRYSIMMKKRKKSDLLRRDRAEKQGFLWKLGGRNGTSWQKRWCAFTADHLTYFASREGAMLAGKQPSGCMHLGAKNVSLQRDVKLQDGTVGLAIRVPLEKRAYTLHGIDEDDTRAWFEVFSRATELPEDTSMPCPYKVLRRTSLQRFGQGFKSIKKNTDAKLTEQFQPDAPAVVDGPLEKLGGKNKDTWQGRFFTLRGGSLFYFIGAQDVRPCGSISLTRDTHVITACTFANKPHVFLIYEAERITILNALSEEERNGWLEAIDSVLAPQKEEAGSVRGPLANNVPVRVGYLWKRGGFRNKSFQKRWLMLFETEIRYYGSHKDVPSSKGVIYVRDIECVEPSDSAPRAFVLRMKTGRKREYLLQAQNDTDVALWVAAVTGLLVGGGGRRRQQTMLTTRTSLARANTGVGRSKTLDAESAKAAIATTSTS